MILAFTEKIDLNQILANHKKTIHFRYGFIKWLMILREKVRALIVWRQKLGIMANTLTSSELGTSCVAKMTIFPFSNKIHQMISRKFSLGKKNIFSHKTGAQIFMYLLM